MRFDVMFPLRVVPGATCGPAPLQKKSVGLPTAWLSRIPTSPIVIPPSLFMSPHWSTPDPPHRVVPEFVPEATWSSRTASPELTDPLLLMSPHAAARASGDQAATVTAAARPISVLLHVLMIFSFSAVRASRRCSPHR